MTARKRLGRPKQERAGRRSSRDRERTSRRESGRARRIPDNGTKHTHMALYLPLLDTEVLSLDVHRTVSSCGPDADEQ